MAAETTLFRDALLVDCAASEPHDRASVVVEGERISGVHLGEIASTSHYDAVVDCAGMALLPGLTDAHVHIGAVDVNILDQHREHPSNLVALMMARILEDTLLQGFTTVRDAGGMDWSFKAAVERGIVEGPRLLISDRPLSQTGGHGDFRRMSETQMPEIFCPTAGMRTMVCDGVAEVRRAARELLRVGADQIKVMASGGAMSPADELSATQYSPEELRAAVEEAEAAPYGKHPMLSDLSWNHTTLWARKIDPAWTYLQCVFDRDTLEEQILATRERYGDGILFHFEYVRWGGDVNPVALPLLKFRSAEQIQETIDFLWNIGVVVADPHTYVLEDGGHEQQLWQEIYRAKAAYDPANLLNPGKLRGMPDN